MKKIYRNIYKYLFCCLQVSILQLGFQLESPHLVCFLFHRSILLPKTAKARFLQALTKLLKCDIVNTLELLQYRYTHFETKTALSQNVCFDLYLEDSKGRICTTVSSFFLKPLFDKLEKTKELLFTVF